MNNATGSHLSKWQRFMGFHEFGTVRYLKAVLTEFLATAILIIAGCGSIVTMESGKPVTPLAGATTFAMTVATIIWTFNHASGAHINPCVSLCFMVTGHLSVVKTVSYIISQCGGAIAGAAVVWYIVPPSWRGTLGSTVFAEEITLAQGFVIEALSTFFLLLGVFASGDRLRTDHAGSMPLTIGLIVFMQSAWAGKPTGCSMNPARTLGPALISGTWDHHWVYWAAPTVGGLSGALFYQYILAEKPADVHIDVTTEKTKIGPTHIEIPVVAEKASLPALSDASGSPSVSTQSDDYTNQA